MLGDGRPVIGLTLRYDRIDNFWFTLLHELAHVGRHLSEDSDDWFADDFTLRNRAGNPRRPQGDGGRRMGRECPDTPGHAWNASAVQEQNPTTDGSD